MAKIGKLTKLKSAIKRWPSFTKLARTTSSIASAAAANDGHHSYKDHIQYDRDNILKELQAVYVGKSRKRYLLSSDIICHPLFQGLMDRSSATAGTADDGDVDDDLDHLIVVVCEVVLFDHLLWMLESGGSQLGSMEELAEFYDCSTY